MTGRACSRCSHIVTQATPCRALPATSQSPINGECWSAPRMRCDEAEDLNFVLYKMTARWLHHLRRQRLEVVPLFIALGEHHALDEHHAG